MIQLMQGDCLDLLKDIPAASVDMVLTDPPFCVGTTSNGKKASWNDNNLVKPFFDLLFQELCRVCKRTAALYIHTDWRTLPLLYPIAMKYFNIPNCIVWDYERIKAGNFYRFSYEMIIFAAMPECKREFSAKERDVWRIKPINFTNPDKLHNAQKPVELCERAICNSSKTGDVILDCFMGSGSTGVACVNTGRSFIGIELDEHYFNVAQNRIHEAAQQKEG